MSITPTGAEHGFSAIVGKEERPAADTPENRRIQNISRATFSRFSPSDTTSEVDSPLSTGSPLKDRRVAQLQEEARAPKGDPMDEAQRAAAQKIDSPKGPLARIKQEARSLRSDPVGEALSRRSDRSALGDSPLAAQTPLRHRAIDRLQAEARKLQDTTYMN